MKWKMEAGRRWPTIGRRWTYAKQGKLVSTIGHNGQNKSLMNPWPQTTTMMMMVDKAQRRGLWTERDGDGGGQSTTTKTQGESNANEGLAKAGVDLFWGILISNRCILCCKNPSELFKFPTESNLSIKYQLVISTFQWIFSTEYIFVGNLIFFLWNIFCRKYSIGNFIISNGLFSMQNIPLIITFFLVVALFIFSTF